MAEEPTLEQVEGEQEEGAAGAGPGGDAAEQQQEGEQLAGPGEQLGRQQGVVKWFNATKGFGFITPSSGGDDLFVHQSSINAEGFRSLREGEDVEFAVETGEDGRTKAVDVSGPAGAAPQGAPRRGGLRGTVRAERGPPRGPPPFAVPGAMPGGMPPVGPGPMGRGGMPPPAYGYDYNPYGYGYDMGYAYFPRGRGRGRGRGGPSPGRGPLPPQMYAGRIPAGPGAPPQQLAGPPPGQPGESSGFQVVVHNLPWTTTWQALKDYFKEWSVERADVVFDSWGRSRGFGTVRFTSREDAEAACAQLNNTEMDGRTVTVRIDRFA